MLTGLEMAAAQVIAIAPGMIVINFEEDTVGQPPAGFASYASGSGPGGKWLVREMADALSILSVTSMVKSSSWSGMPLISGVNRPVDQGRQRHRFR